MTVFTWSPSGLRFEPDILVSIHDSAPGSSQHFRKPENISDGVHKHVVITCGNATTSRIFILMLLDNGQFLMPFPYGKSSLPSQ